MSIGSVLGIRVQKAFLTNLDTGESKSFLFNPAELEETFGVNWQMFEAPGMSHKRPQFISGENMTWSLVALFDQLFYEKNRTTPVGAAVADPIFGHVSDLAPKPAAVSEKIPSEVEDWRAFILSLATPTRPRAGGVNAIAAAAPPKIHFEWPGLVSTTVRVKGGKFKHTMFRVGTARTRIYSLELQIFEDPAERLYSDDVRARGTIRNIVLSPFGFGATA
jgi:hypothetical protein